MSELKIEVGRLEGHEEEARRQRETSVVREAQVAVAQVRKAGE